MGQYFTWSLAASTQQTYSSGKNRFIKFCQQAGVAPLPACENVLCWFCAHLANQNLKYRTIKVYLSAVRHMQIAERGDDPFEGRHMARLNYVLRGIKKRQSTQSQGERERLPITPPLLRRIKVVWEEDKAQGDKPMLWAACCLCFFCISSSRGVDCPTRWLV